MMAGEEITMPLYGGDKALTLYAGFDPEDDTFVFSLLHEGDDLGKQYFMALEPARARDFVERFDRLLEMKFAERRVFRAAERRGAEAVEYYKSRLMGIALAGEVEQGLKNGEA